MKRIWPWASVLILSVMATLSQRREPPSPPSRKLMDSTPPSETEPEPRAKERERPVGAVGQIVVRETEREFSLRRWVLHEPMELELFPDERITVVFESTEPASRTSPRTVWRGAVVGEDDSMATFVAGDASVTGTIRIPGRNPIHIAPICGALHSVREIDPRLAPPCGLK